MLDSNGQFINQTMFYPGTAFAAGSVDGSAGAYGGATPTITGSDGMHTLDTDTGRVWWYLNGAWV